MNRRQQRHHFFASIASLLTRWLKAVQGWSKPSGRLRITRKMYLDLLNQHTKLVLEHADFCIEYHQANKDLQACRERLELIEPELKRLQAESLQPLIQSIEHKLRIIQLEQQVGKAYKIARIFDQ